MEFENTKQLEVLNQEAQKYLEEQDHLAQKLLTQQQLFDSELPKWERIIATLAYNLISTRTIDRGLLEPQDIANTLRLKVWDAIRKYDPTAVGIRGEKAALNTWITRLLKQECVLIMQAHYNKVPRERKRILFSIKDEAEQARLREAFNRGVIPESIWQEFDAIFQPLVDTATVEAKVKEGKETTVWFIVDSEEIYTVKQLQEGLNVYQEGKVQLPIPLVSTATDGEEGFMDLPDPNAEAAFELVIEEPWFQNHIDLVLQVLQDKSPGGLNEPLVFSMILSGRYSSDKEISEQLHANWAKVGEVRFKAKLVFALMESIPISSFTRAQNAVVMAKRVRSLLIPIVEDLPAVVL